MRVLVADDEAPARARLVALLETAAGRYEVVAQAANGMQVLSHCDQQVIDLVLLDIRMPGMDGIQVARSLVERPQPPAVVFVTAYDEHALAAFDANAIDYLLKPVRPERLLRALDKASALTRSQTEALSAATAFVTASHRGGVVRIAASEVLFLRADSKYVEVWYPEGVALSEESLRAIEERLPGVFIRVHRNALVSPGRLRGLVRGPGGRLLATLQGSTEQVEVSRRHSAEVRRLLRGRDPG